MTQIIINEQNRRPAAPDLYGLFFEDINRAGDSGIYPEMLRNRSFEDSVEPLETTVTEDGAYFITKTGFREDFSHGEGCAAWAARHPYTPIPAWYAENASMELDRVDVLHKNRLAALKVDFEAGGMIRNIGYVGVSAEEGTPLLFYAFVKADRETTLTVGLRSKEGALLASADVTVLPGSYTRVDARLVPTATDPDASFVIISKEACSAAFGFTSLMPEETFMGHGLRKDLVELLGVTKSQFMRYPGGCVVEGLNRDTALRFTDTVGPVWERPGKWNLWHYHTTNGFGFHEYLQLCEDLNMEALYVINCGMSCQARNPEFFLDDDMDEMLDQAMWAMEYAMGDISTKYGALRAEMGHPEPFCIKYIEIGNENDGPEYYSRYKVFYDALQKAYPDVILISNAHTEVQGLPTPYVDEHYYCDWQYFAQSGHLYDHYPKDGPKIFIGEYAVTRGHDVGTLRSALAETNFLLGAERNPEVVKLTAYAPLFENIHYRAWNPNLIFFDNHRSAALPFLYALGMLGGNRGRDILDVTVTTDKLAPEKFGFVGMIAYGHGLRMKKPVVNGKERSVEKEILGYFLEDGDGYFADASRNDSKRLDSVTRYPFQMDYVNGIFSDKKATETVYSVKVFIDENTPKFALTLWVHNTTEPEVRSLRPDGTDPGAKDFWLINETEYYTWTIDHNTERAYYLYRYQEQPMNEAAPISLRMGEYNEFTVKTDALGYDCYVNGEFVRRVEDRKYGRVETVVTEDEEYLYVKLLNNSETEEPVTLKTGIACEREYSYELLTGAPADRNSLEDPCKVNTKVATGTFPEDAMTYTCPAWSFSVLKLRKK